MKKIILFFSVLFMLSATLFAQIQDGDIQLVQKYFGAEKAALVKEYMALSPAQDSVFWNDYNAYETLRLELGKDRILFVDEYAKAINNLTDEKAKELVGKANANDIAFKELQLKYFKKFSKTIGVVKAAQFYQLEGYINNIINLSVQESIPFVGEMEQKHK
jgi:hypothetical protein